MNDLQNAIDTIKATASTTSSTKTTTPSYYFPEQDMKLSMFQRNKYPTPERILELLQGNIIVKPFISTSEGGVNYVNAKIYKTTKGSNVVNGIGTLMNIPNMPEISIDANPTDYSDIILEAISEINLISTSEDEEEL